LTRIDASALAGADEGRADFCDFAKINQACHTARATDPVGPLGVRAADRRRHAMLSQSVLLKGSMVILRPLAPRCGPSSNAASSPYCLNHLDRAPGTSHFRTPLARGRELMRELRARYSGLCQPTYVRDGADGEGKVPVGPSTRERHSAGASVRNRKSRARPSAARPCRSCGAADDLREPSNPIARPT